VNTPSAEKSRADTYLDYFSLACAPYANEPDPRFFYAGSTLSQRLDLLTHLTQFGDSIVIVAGPKGSGKTTLLDHFARRVNSSWTVAHLTASDINDFRQALATRLTGGGDSSTKQLLTDWMNRSQASDLLVVVIDDADQLTDSAIQQLAVLFDPAFSARTRLILFGTSETGGLAKKAQEQGLIRGATQLLEMPRLSDEDTAAYLVFRLAVAGFSGESPFSPTQVSAIAKSSNGRPGEVNRLADQCLFEQFEHAANRPGNRRSAVIHRALPILSAALGLAVLAGLWQVFSRQTNNPPFVAVTEPSHTENIDSDEGTKSADTVVANTDSALATPDADAVAPAPTETTSPESAPTDTQAEGGANQSNSASAESEQAEPTQPVVTVSPETAPAPSVQSAKTEPPATNTVPAVPTETPHSNDLAHREDWLLAQSAKRYTLQLLGSRSEEGARGFIRQFALPADKVSYYKGLYKGGDWYVVVYGSYSSRSAAITDIKNLPEALRAAKPWPRPMQSVHDAIRSTQNP